ncbi:hypothetical protein N8I74_11015 [Chitiniphilus purpureus]|uniref:DUF4376 domain-containing protein n=1 Tax=Chitiniphilus purpureus TaxID=2981137 RepID=A0ABY6DHN0_9NEIS|nr:hypothetical protein [Chitiniphilus sp. CD1]UXY13852.1 hypothetical protein N8I74_11015 [Chitiniphilus sp. CD1]
MIKTNASDLREEIAPVYCQYQGQSGPQPAYITIHPESESASAGYSSETGNGCPESIYHNRAYRVRIPADVRGTAIAEFLEDTDTQALISSIIAGYSCDWDGSNHRGSLNDDAESALAELEQAAERLQWDDCRAQIWDEDMLGVCFVVEHWPTAKTLPEAIAEIEAAAESEGASIECDLNEYLLDRAALAFESGNRQIGETHVAALLAAGKIDEDEAQEWRATQAD